MLTEKQISEIYKRSTAKKQASWKGFINPTFTTYGRGKIQVLSKRELLDNHYVKNFILLKDNEPQFLHIYSESTSEQFHNLVPGSYTLYSLLDDNSYYKSTNIVVMRNATTFIDFQKDARMLPDETSDLINEKIKEIQESNNYSILGRNEDFEVIKKAISIDERVNRYTGATVFGVVSDAEDGTPLPGVNVIIKGTSIGTVTNFDGEYQIVVPEKYRELVFSFVGFMTEEVPIGAIREMNVTLSADVNELQEVVVVGYGMQEKRSLTGSVTAIRSEGINLNLSGKVAGVAISGQTNSSAKVQIRGANTIDASSGPFFVIDGVPYSGSDLEISPDMIKSIEVLNSDQATAIYGSRAVNGVVLISLKAGTEVLNTVMANNTFMEAMEASSSIRNNFSDYAYWEPKLRTDKNGLASFKVRFPDDITAWKTHVLGMTDKRQSGQYEGEIKAFKTVAGTLATPTFLVEEDSTALIGKALNYTSDSLEIAVAFEVNGVVNYSVNHKILHSNIDTLRITAPKADTVDFQYSITKNDGYFDGELRRIPVYKRGIQETVGDFYALEKDTVFTYKLPFNDKPFTISATSNVLEVLMEEADNIRRYEYLCNEQIASKIKALLVLKKIKKFQDEDFKYDQLLKRLINNLQKNQKNQLWGWWPESVGSYWISLHVLEALLDAEKDGYKISLDRQPIIDLLAYNFETRSQYDQIRILKILNLLEASFDYKSHLDSLENKKLPFANHIQVQVLKQALDFPYTLDSLFKYQKETMFGGIYWEEPDTKVYSNTVLTTVNAYQLIKKSGKNPAMLSKIRSYFLESRRNTGYWRNTYEASKILETILPDLLEEEQKYEKPSIAINSTKVNKNFPFEIVNDPAEEVIISRTGTGPVFLSVSQEFWNESPEKVEEDFILTSKFDEGNTSFTAGKETTFKVNLNIQKEAEYIMLEIPVPAGFSYVSKTKQPFEDHREHYKNKVNIYFTRLSAGSYNFDIKLLPRFSGSYHLNPAKASLMYFPVFYGRNEGKRVEVR